MPTVKQTDSLGRKIDYLRVSVTEDCDLDCVYCERSAKQRLNPLNTADFLKIIGVVAGLGISKVRLTGGEPLLFDALPEIIEGAFSAGIADVPISTNGLLLFSRIEELKAAGLKRVNISLDSLSRDTYKQITGKDGLDSVLGSLDAALKAGLKVKINMVPIRGLNSGEISSFIELAQRLPVQVRFIELMPLGAFGDKNRHRLVTAADILERYPFLKPVGRMDGVSQLFSADGFCGTVGFISPMSRSFCAECNRLRLTSDGKLKSCLGGKTEIDIVPALREGRVAEILSQTLASKPDSHNFLSGSGFYGMRDIGG